MWLKKLVCYFIGHRSHIVARLEEAMQVKTIIGCDFCGFQMTAYEPVQINKPTCRNCSFWEEKQGQVNLGECSGFGSKSHQVLGIEPEFTSVLITQDIDFCSAFRWRSTPVEQS